MPVDEALHNGCSGSGCSLPGCPFVQENHKPSRCQTRSIELTGFRNFTTAFPLEDSSFDDYVTKAFKRPDACRIKILPQTLTTNLTGLNEHDLEILNEKQQWLSTYRPVIPRGSPQIEAAVNATLVFAQEDAGTAVCISPAGMLLTCSHCIAESSEDLGPEKRHWLLFASGQVVEAKYLAWESGRDLALLKIVAVQQRTDSSQQPNFPSINVADKPPKSRSQLVCIGHPGSEDLETSVPGVKTNYDVLYVSEGKFRGYAPGQDLHDNSEIGALMHDCWTYWGHSGAPLVDRISGELVGLHSSWDDETGMRRGIALEAIQKHVKDQFGDVEYHERMSWIG